MNHDRYNETYNTSESFLMTLWHHENKDTGNWTSLPQRDSLTHFIGLQQRDMLLITQKLFYFFHFFSIFFLYSISSFVDFVVKPDYIELLLADQSITDRMQEGDLWPFNAKANYRGMKKISIFCNFLQLPY